MSKPTLYGIKNCDTVKRARAWLDTHAVDYEFHDFKSKGVPVDALARWFDVCGWEAVLNRQGTTWRKLDDATKASVQDVDSATAVMVDNASVIKRPVVEWADGGVTVGFSEAVFASRRHA
ncbi:ArsC family reductase [soil metagenome]